MKPALGSYSIPRCMRPQWELWPLNPVTISRALKRTDFEEKFILRTVPFTLNSCRRQWFPKASIGY